MAKWNPIETAPKDGTQVDLWTAAGRVTDCRWDYERGRWEHWWMDDMDTFCWMHWVPVLQPPTHWMEIPAGPGAGK